MEGHSFAKRLSDNETQLVADLTRKHVAPRDILGIIKELNENNVSTLQTIYNARSKIQRLDHEGKTPMQVRYQLLDELHQAEDRYRHVFGKDFDEMHESLCFVRTGTAPRRKWMIMPGTGVLIVNRFGVIIHFLSKKGSITCFPLWKGSKEIEHHRAITIAHVHGMHYIMVRLEGDYPMPTTMALWNHYKHQSATGWQSKYMHRLQIYIHQLPSFSSDIIDV